MWDTCGPQAILNSLNGNILIYDKLASAEIPLEYNTDKRVGESKLDICCNVGGIVAYRDKGNLSRILNILQN